MGDRSAIEWTDATWNPVVGCSIVSPGCTHCYAMQQAARIERMTPGSHYAGTTMPAKAGPVWTGKLALAPEHIVDVPLRWWKPRRIFVNSMGDLFHEDVPDAWIDRVFAIMALAPQHTFQVLTKRAARMRAYMLAPRQMDIMGQMALLDGRTSGKEGDCLFWPPPHVWLGVSAEDQLRADERVPHLLATPAAVRFVSAEPLLGPIDFRPWLSGDDGCEECDDGSHGQPHHCQRRDIPREQQCPRRFSVFNYAEGPRDGEGTPAWIHERRQTLDLIIVGGESGRRARPMHPDWVRQIRDDCAAGGAAFFFKQWGAWQAGLYSESRHTALLDPSNGPNHGLTLGPPPHPPSDVHRWDDSPTISVRRAKSDAGRMLDGRTHDDLPAAR